MVLSLPSVKQGRVVMNRRDSQARPSAIVEYDAKN